MDPYLLLVLAAVCGFAFLNGFRDVSNAVAVAVRTRALTPTVAVLAAGLFAFAGTLISTGLGAALFAAGTVTLPEGRHALGIMLAGIVAAGAWGLYCWWRGIPMSSTHAVISGLAGASGAAALLGAEGLRDAAGTLLLGVGLPLLVTPLVGFAAAYLLAAVADLALRYTSPADASWIGRVGQAIGACAVALGIGLQDSQRNAVLLTLALTVSGSSPQGVPFGAALVAAVFLAAGMAFGGWRIGHTIAYRLVRVDPVRGMTAQIVSAAMLYLGALALHLPLSTTQAVTSTTVGAGANQRFETVAWRMVLRVLAYWVGGPVLCVLVAGVLYLALHPLFG